MSPENKQRVVGIIVLVAFIALLVPFLFTNGVKKRHKLDITNDTLATATTTQLAQTQGVAADAAISNPPVINGNQQVPANGALSGDLQQQTMPAGQRQPVGLPQDQSLPQAILPATTNTQVAPSVSEAELSKQGAPTATTIAEALPPSSTAPVDINVNNVNAAGINDQAKIVADTAVVEQSVAVKTTKSTIAAKDKKKGAKAKSLAAKKGKNKGKNSTNGAAAFWSVQVGSFSDQVRMQKFVNDLQAKGFEVYMQKITTSKGAMVRVLVGHEASKKQAKKIVNKLKTELKINGHVVGNNK